MVAIGRSMNGKEKFSASLRSPCGTGTSARMAQRVAKGLLKVGDDFVHESIIGTLFHGRVEAAAKPVVDRQRRRDERPVALIGRQRAECRRADEEQRNVADTADEHVVLNRVNVVEVEGVVEVIGVGEEDGEKENKWGETESLSR